MSGYKILVQNVPPCVPMTETLALQWLGSASPVPVDVHVTTAPSGTWQVFLTFQSAPAAVAAMDVVRSWWSWEETPAGWQWSYFLPRFMRK